MAISKRVKTGGSFYRGYKLDVASATGAYYLAIVPTAANFAVNGFSVTPGAFGDDDTFDLYHVDTTATVGGKVIAVLCTGINNVGGGVSLDFDFAALELVNPGESLRFVYNNSAEVALTNYIRVETIR